MKNSLFKSWVTYFYVSVMFFNLKPTAYAGGDDVPKFRAKYQAEEIPLINRIGRGIFGPGKLQAPHIDDESKNPVKLNARQSSGVCHPKRRPPTPLLVAEVPPPIPLLVAEVPPAPIQRLLVAEVPSVRHQELLVANVPSSLDVMIVADVPDPLPPIVNYIQLPCPPVEDCCPPEPGPTEIYVEERQRVNRHQRHRHVEHQERFVQEQPFFQDGFVQQPIFQDQFNCHQGGFPGNHFAGNQVWQQNGGHPGWQQGQQQGWQNGGHQGVQQGGGNYDRAMAWGHHVVNNAYGIGYGIGTNAYDIGRSW